MRIIFLRSSEGGAAFIGDGCGLSVFDQSDGQWSRTAHLELSGLPKSLRVGISNNIHFIATTLTKGDISVLHNYAYILNLLLLL